MQKSKFNILKVIGDYIYLYNGLTWSVIRFPNEFEPLIYNILDFPEAVNGSKEIQLTKDILYGNGFLIDDDKSEMELLKQRYNYAKNHQNYCALQIAVTMQCNFACPYCYENEENSSLSAQTQDAIINYIARNIDKWDRLCLDWFGGEPLLRPDIIRNLSNRAMELCKISKTEYLSTIITNGYLLNKKNLELLEKYRVREIQVTLDGGRKTHDSRRFLKNGKGTFDTIVNNLILGADIFDKIIVRVNIEGQRPDDISELFVRLNPIKDKLHIGFMPIQTTVECDGHSNNYASFRRENYSYGRLIDSHGFNPSVTHTPPGGLFCAAYNNNFLLIDPKGNLYRCTVMAGKTEYRIGYLQDDGTIKKTSDQSPHLEFDPFEDKDCKVCDHLPICMGGCINMPLSDKSNSGRCIIKDTVPSYLSSIAQKYENLKSVKGGDDDNNRTGNIFKGNVI
ncbi:MAG: radical SAM protein [Candidatus Zixiibacteriota bacterium]